MTTTTNTQSPSSSSPATFPVKIIIIEKLGSLRELQIKNFKEEDLFKKAGFKSANHFALHHKYEIDDNTRVHIYGKITGIAGQENRYELPPPLDNTLFFGNCLLVKYVNEEPVNIQMNEWNVMYSKLFGEFESLTEGDSEGEEEEENIQDLKNLKEIVQETKSRKIHFTKQGYAKDGFIVGDDDDDDDGFDDEDDCRVKKIPKTAENSKRKRGKSKADTANDTTIPIKEEEEQLYFQGNDELKEEMYI